MLRKGELHSTLLLVLSFLGCGLLHVALYGVPYTSEIVRIVFSTATLLWASSIRERIIDVHVRRLLIGVAGAFMLLFLLQICNYQIFMDQAINRNLEYAYYTPIILIPLLIFEIALYLNRQTDEEISPLWHWLWLPAIALILLFVTNDLHQCVFAFQGELTRTDHSRHVLGFWIFVAWAAVLLIVALSVFIHKCRLPMSAGQLWGPLLPVALGITLLLVSMLIVKPRLWGVQIWNMGEIYAFMGIGFLEACIQNGLIPSNQHYRKVFSLLEIPANIESTQGEERYTTAGSRIPLESGEDWQLNTASISGGRVSWLVDLRNLHRLNHELQTTVEQLESRNNLLQAEAALQKEKEQHETRSRLYAHIARAVQPQLDKIEKRLFEHPEADPDNPENRITAIAGHRDFRILAPLGIYRCIRHNRLTIIKAFGKCCILIPPLKGAARSNRISGFD